MKKRYLSLLYFICILFIGCKENNMKIKIYYNTPNEWPDVGRSIDFIKNGQCEYTKLYNLEDFGVKDIKFLQEYEKAQQSNTGVDESAIDNIIGLSMLRAETLFEILDENNKVVFSYLYFENEDYFLDTKDYKVYHMTEEIKNLSRKVISRANIDNNVE